VTFGGRPSRRITITGGSGRLGQVLRRGLAERGYEIDVFDQLSGSLLDALRRAYPVQGSYLPSRAFARTARVARRGAETALGRVGAFHHTGDDILGDRGALAKRFEQRFAVIHLAGIPHPHTPGASDADFIRLNYDGALNVFEAACEAGVPLFIFASSAQVYKINDPVRLEQLPVLESNYLPLPAEGQSTYGFLKAAFERYLAGACHSGATQAISLRLECPGSRSTAPWNLYISTSVENLIAGFAAALEAPDGFAHDAFNLADSKVDRRIVDIQRFVSSRWPYVPNHTKGNECLLSTEKSRNVLGYSPAGGGRYMF
jgi:nucleoside-diphosphate-sugar epimerase